MYAPANQYVPQCVPPDGATARGPLIVWGVVCAIALVLLGLVFAAPLLLASEHNSLAGAIYKGFGFLCHQIPERSFHLAGHQLGVCARCTGLYAGLAGGALLYPLVRSLGRADSPPRIWLFLACVPVMVDFGLGFFGVWENTHFSRFASAAILGTVCALFVVPGLLDLGRIIQERLRRTGEATSETRLTVGTDHTEAQTAPSDYSAPYRRI